MAQLADILVDWCEADLEGFSTRGPTHVAQEMVRCLAFTLANCQDAREVLERIVRNEMAEIRSRFEDEDR
jgi:hypothetical protein